MNLQERIALYRYLLYKINVKIYKLNDDPPER